MTDETRELNRVIDRRNRWKTAGSLVVAFVAFAALVFSATQYVTRAEQQEQRADQQQGRADEATTAVDLLCAQVERLGRRCVVEPAELQGEPIPPTDEQLRPLVAEYVDEWLSRNPPADGRDAPTLAELSDVIVDEIAAELERNPPPRGEPGEPPTPEQLRPIVVDVVAEHLRATPPPPGQDGADGQDGQDGAPGADSTVPGPPGEPPLSWTFTTRDALGQPTTHRCVRDEPFDANTPTYTCTEQEEGP